MGVIDTYLQIHRADGVVENWHFYFLDTDVYLDFLNGMKGKKVKITDLTRLEFDQGGTPFHAPVHQDKYEDGDAQGDYMGYVEHYEA